MNWQAIFELVFLAALAIGLIAYSTSRIREVEAGAKALAEEAAKAAEHTTRKEWYAKYRNLQVLRDLQVTFSEFSTTIFGSCVESGKFVAPGWGNDVDLMIEVDEETFSSWATLAYEGRALGDERKYIFDYNSYPHEGTVVEVLGREVWIPPYSGVFPTRIARRMAAQQVLGIDIEALKLDVDIFLFPHSFVRGELAIPAWDGTAPETGGRSFRDEVLAGVKLADLEPE